MKEEKYLEVEKFYLRIGEILGIGQEIIPIKEPRKSMRTGISRSTNATRWGPRAPGNGRFEGFGIIRVYGSTVHVSLRHPVAIHKVFQSREEVIEFLEKMMLV
jgi:hypothetical protein